MALLLTSVFGVTGCGSDDDVEVESRVKNAAPEASAVSDAPSESDCDLLDRSDILYLLEVRWMLERLDLNDLLDQNNPDYSDLRDRSDIMDRIDPLVRTDAIALLEEGDIRDLLGQCDAASDSGADSVTTTTVPPAPEASGASDGPSEDDCFRDLRYLSDLLDLNRLDLVDSTYVSDLRYLVDLLDRLELLLDQCDAVSKSGATEPEGDGVDRG